MTPAALDEAKGAAERYLAAKAEWDAARKGEDNDRLDRAGMAMADLEQGEMPTLARAVVALCEERDDVMLLLRGCCDFNLGGGWHISQRALDSANKWHVYRDGVEAFWSTSIERRVRPFDSAVDALRAMRQLHRDIASTPALAAKAGQ